VGTSIGVVQISAELGDLSTLMAAADAACYAAKRGGRNRVRLHRPPGFRPTTTEETLH
jgi:PleD family two-component response regulator